MTKVIEVQDQNCINGPASNMQPLSKLNDAIYNSALKYLQTQNPCPNLFAPHNEIYVCGAEKPEPKSGNLNLLLSTNKKDVYKVHLTYSFAKYIFDGCSKAEIFTLNNFYAITRSDFPVNYQEVELHQRPTSRNSDFKISTPSVSMNSNSHFNSHASISNILANWLSAGWEVFCYLMSCLNPFAYGSSPSNTPSSPQAAF